MTFAQRRRRTRRTNRLIATAWLWLSLLLWAALYLLARLLS